MTIKTLIFNWFFTNDGGDEYQRATVGEPFANSTVMRIEEHEAAGEGDKWFYDVFLVSGENIRVFNPNTVLRDAA